MYYNTYILCHFVFYCKIKMNKIVPNISPVK